ncbi:hypothetical protein AHAS_Ahas15G0174100 [Arachis hypogaea]
MASANTPSETPSSQEQGSTPDASIGTQKNNNRAKTDHAWGHCKQVVESGKTILLCIYCEKLIRGGGIHWFKLHLAGKGGDVELVERCQLQRDTNSMKVLKSFEARKEKLKNNMPKVIMLVMMLKENLTRSNVMRCNNNKNPGFQHLTLEKENKSKVYNSIFHRQQHPELNQLSKAFFKAKKLWRSVILLLRNGWWMPLFHLMRLIQLTISQ